MTLKPLVWATTPCGANLLLFLFATSFFSLQCFSLSLSMMVIISDYAYGLGGKVGKDDRQTTYLWWLWHRRTKTARWQMLILRMCGGDGQWLLL